MANGHHIVRLEFTSALEMLNLLQVASDQIACSVGLDEDTSHRFCLSGIDLARSRSL